MLVTLNLIIIKIFLFSMPSEISAMYIFLENLQAVFSIFKVTRTVFELRIQMISFNLNALLFLYETHNSLFSFFCKLYVT